MFIVFLLDDNLVFYFICDVKIYGFFFDFGIFLFDYVKNYFWYKLYRFYLGCDYFMYFLLFVFWRL